MVKEEENYVHVVCEWPLDWKVKINLGISLKIQNYGWLQLVIFSIRILTYKCIPDTIPSNIYYYVTIMSTYMKVILRLKFILIVKLKDHLWLLIISVAPEPRLGLESLVFGSSFCWKSSARSSFQKARFRKILEKRAF